MNNAIKSISILISFKSVKRKTIFKAIAARLLTVKSRKNSTNFFKSQIGRDKLRHRSCSSFFQKIRENGRKGARESKIRKGTRLMLLSELMFQRICGKLFEQSHHDRLTTLLRQRKRWKDSEKSERQRETILSSSSILTVSSTRPFQLTQNACACFAPG